MRPFGPNLLIKKAKMFMNGLLETNKSENFESGLFV